MNWVAIIPVRAGSKGVKNKNIRCVEGKPLYRYTVDFARELGANQIFLTTDIQEILSSPKENNLTVIKRDAFLCQDNTPIASVILNFLSSSEGIKINDDETLVLLQATSPIRIKSHLLDALEQFKNSEDVDLMMSVTQTKNNALKYGYVVNGNFNHISSPSFCFENRQNLPELFKPTGAFYIFKAGWYRLNKNLVTKATKAFIIPNSQSLDIDSVEDFKRFEASLLNRGK